MSAEPPPSSGEAPHVVPPPAGQISPEDLARLIEASGMPTPVDVPGKSALRRNLVIGVLVAGIGLGASIMSCVGQSFSLRQARAQEGIEQQLKEIRTHCAPMLLQPPPSGEAR